MSGAYDRKDHYYRKAKEDGFRSRAAYKLIEINKQYAIIKQGYKVADLGAWPGGWLQVAAKAAGPNGLVIGIDLQAIDPLPDENVKLITGDARDEDNLEQIRSWCNGSLDTVVSDMSPKITGIREADHAASAATAELAFYIAAQLLKDGGSFVCKVFKSNDTDQFVKMIRPVFNKVVRSELDSSRKTSTEYYVLGFGFRREIAQKSCGR